MAPVERLAGVMRIRAELRRNIELERADKGHAERRDRARSSSSRLCQTNMCSRAMAGMERELGQVSV